MEEHKERATHPPRSERRPPGQPDRDAVIVRTGAVSICVNLALAGMKAAVGLAARSIAVVTDAVNNLSDALSGVVTILGAKLSGKMPDKKHPLGYGRVEYLSATAVAARVSATRRTEPPFRAPAARAAAAATTPAPMALAAAGQAATAAAAAL